MCFNELQNTFNSVQYPILFKHLFEAGINRKTWRLLCELIGRPGDYCMIGTTALRAWYKLMAPYHLPLHSSRESYKDLCYLLISNGSITPRNRRELCGPWCLCWCICSCWCRSYQYVNSEATSVIYATVCKRKCCGVELVEVWSFIVPTSKPNVSSPLCTQNEQHPLFTKESAMCLGAIGGHGTSLLLRLLGRLSIRPDAHSSLLEYWVPIRSTLRQSFQFCCTVVRTGF